jgi:hypothetical protein
VDKETFQKLEAERESIRSKLNALDVLAAKLDVVFADAEKAGISIFRKTHRGLLYAEIAYRKLHRVEHADWAEA